MKVVHWLLLVRCSRYCSLLLAAPRPLTRTPPSSPTACGSCPSPRTRSRCAGTPRPTTRARIQRYVVNGIYHDGTSTTKTMTGLVPNYSATYRVVAVDAAGNSSAPSAPLTATTARDTTAPTAVTGLRSPASTPSSVSLAWNAAYRPLVAELCPVRRLDAAAGRAPARGLAPGSTHTFSVRARDTSGNLGAASNAVTITLPGQRRHDRTRAAVEPDRRRRAGQLRRQHPQLDAARGRPGLRGLPRRDAVRAA